MGGEIRLRVRWSNEQMTTGESEQQGFKFDLSLSQISVSVIESSSRKLPREIMVEQ